MVVIGIFQFVKCVVLFNIIMETPKLKSSKFIEVIIDYLCGTRSKKLCLIIFLVKNNKILTFCIIRL